MHNKLVITFVHGTFARDSAWIQKDGCLSTVLRRLFKDRVEIAAFQWSGRNSLVGRFNAAIELRAHLRKFDGAPGTVQFVIAHSHGGNIACYALSRLRKPSNVLGLVCMATPFLHARIRDPRLFTAIRWFNAFFGLFAVCYLPFAWLLGWKRVLLITIANFLIACFLGAGVESVLKYLRGSVEKFADACNAFAPNIPLLIVRAVGDEASLALGSSQFLSWAAARVLAQVGPRRNSKVREVSRKRLLPRTVRFLWWLSLGLFLLGQLVWFLNWRLGIDDSGTIRGVILILLLTIVLPTWMFAMFRKGYIPHFIVNAFALVFFTIAALIEVSSAGTIPEEESFSSDNFDNSEMDGGATAGAMPYGRLGRWALGIFLTLLVEIKTETTPLGRHEVVLLNHDGNVRQEDEKNLAHSVNESRQARRAIVEWIAEICEPQKAWTYSRARQVE